MDLSDMNVNEFTALLGSDAPAPGGGSAAALSGALGAALSAMVAALTVGRPRYTEWESSAAKAFGKADMLRREMLLAMEEDTAAYRQVGAAMALPRGTEEEKTARSEALQAALAVSTESPLKIMELSLEALELTMLLIGRSNPNALSDLGVAALCLKAALKGAWLNVLINIGSLKDEEMAETYRFRGEALLEQGCTLADEIYESVEEKL
ncbi:MAG: cyclodeaminase/cyclohydrolase family protein [Lachnospiraceae bacterium]|nr:cyclodeaminase/cyclohydrolase family protein [Lachnospiraceae bacterium]